MRKRLCFLAFAAALFSISGARIVLAEITSVPEYVLEIDSDGNDLPVIDAEGKTFTIDLFSYEDKTLESPLAESVTRWVFPKTGNYRIRYNIEGGETRDGILRVQDTTPPEIELENVYDENLLSGDVIELIPANARDNSGKTDIDVSLQVWLGGEEITSRFSNGKYTIEQAGEYRFVYTAVDESGNVGERTVVLSVGKGEFSPDKPGGCGDSEFAWIGLSALGLIAVRWRR